MESICTDPIFVVGFPRSGTTLLTAMLAAHSLVASGPETHVFAKLSRREKDDAVSDPGWPDLAATLLSELAVTGLIISDSYGLTREDIASALGAKLPSLRALQEVFPEAVANRQRKPIWIEKSPAHLRHVREIRASFPDARIIRICRDPRDVVLSMSRTPFANPDPLACCIRIHEDHARSADFFRSDSLSRTVLFENLLSDPEAELRTLCRFLRIPFERSMLDFQDDARALVTEGERWKTNVFRPLDRGRAYAWKRSFSGLVETAVSTWCHEAIAESGYERPVVAIRKLAAIGMTQEIVQRHSEFFAELLAAGILPIRSKDLAQPGDVLVFTAVESAPGRSLLSTLKRAVLFLFRRLTGRRTFLVKIPDPSRRTFAERLFEKSLVSVIRPATDLLGATGH